MCGKNVLYLIILPVLCGLFFCSGCVERKLTINTSPADALIVLNDEEVGTSPVTIGFQWYGDYNVRISKKGYQTLVTHRKLKRPTHDRFPFDLFATLWPGRIVNEYRGGGGGSGSWIAIVVLLVIAAIGAIIWWVAK